MAHGARAAAIAGGAMRAAWRLAAAMLVAAALQGPAVAASQSIATPPVTALEEVPYVQTPDNVVDTILGLAGVGPGDTLIDLGSGDGRIVITAARRFGTRGLGVELDPALVELSNTRAAQAGVADRARFAQQDLFDTDLSGASVVTLYLLPDVNLALRPRLLSVLAPGARVVSHDWDMGDWRPDRSVTIDVPNKPVGREKRSTVHLWLVPARVDGQWTLQLDAGPAQETLRLDIAQRFQQVALTATPARGQPWRGTGRLRGEQLDFTLRDGDRMLRFEGVARGGELGGSVDSNGRRLPWRAVPAAR